MPKNGVSHLFSKRCLKIHQNLPFQTVAQWGNFKYSQGFLFVYSSHLFASSLYYPLNKPALLKKMWFIIFFRTYYVTCHYCQYLISYCYWRTKLLFIDQVREMPCKHFFTLIFVIFSFLVYCSNVYSKIRLPSPCPSSPIKQTFIRNINYSCRVNVVTQKHLFFNCFNIFQIFIIFFGLISLLWLLFLHACTQVKYATFNTNLNLFNKKNYTPSSLKFIKVYFSYFFQPIWDSLRKTRI